MEGRICCSRECEKAIEIPKQSPFRPIKYQDMQELQNTRLISEVLRLYKESERLTSALFLFLIKYQCSLPQRIRALDPASVRRRKETSNIRRTTCKVPVCSRQQASSYVRYVSRPQPYYLDPSPPTWRIDQTLSIRLKSKGTFVFLEPGTRHRTI